MSGRDLTASGPVGTVRAFATAGGPLRDAVGFSHAALLYDGTDGAAGAAVLMARRAAEAGAALQVVLPGPLPGPVQAAVRGLPPGTATADMADLGRNPARIIPAGLSFADEHAGQPVWLLWEPAWPARSTAELREVARHETLCNLAFGTRPVTIVCLYDTARLPDDVITSAEQTHPLVIASGTQHPSGVFLGPGRFPRGCDDPLPAPRADPASISFDGQLGPVREFSAMQAQAAGLDSGRIADLVLAVSEIAANSLGHAGGGGVVRSWCADDEILCQIEDFGHIDDPLAGRRRRPADSRGGHGLWLVNRVCDLVEQRSGPDGTITRLHMRIG